MSSGRLEKSEGELNALLREVQKEISSQSPSNYGDDRRRTVQQLKQKLNHAETLVRDVQLEMQVAPKGIQQEIFNRLAWYKADIASLRHQLASSSDMRQQLFGWQEEEEEEDPVEAGERDQLLKNTATLKRASESLYRTQQVSAQTDEVADQVVMELDDQRATLLRTRDRVTGIEGEMERTKSLLRTLFCKAIENRLILICVIIVELVLLAGLTYWKFFS